MPTKLLNLPCGQCQAVMPHSTNQPNHLLHLLLTVFTAGIWLIVWIIIAMGAGKAPAQCTRCGGQRQIAGPA